LAHALTLLATPETTDMEKWIRKKTREKFGPVLSVEKHQVCEVAFEGINLSTRNKSGIAVRFPRIVRWRRDLAARDADTLDQVKALIHIQDATTG